MFEFFIKYHFRYKGCLGYKTIYIVNDVDVTKSFRKCLFTSKTEAQILYKRGLIRSRNRIKKYKGAEQLQVKWLGNILAPSGDCSFLQSMIRGS
jgi:hypothetical protein